MPDVQMVKFEQSTAAGVATGQFIYFNPMAVIGIRSNLNAPDPSQSSTITMTGEPRIGAVAGPPHDIHVMGPRADVTYAIEIATRPTQSPRPLSGQIQ
jgi:hypothetical protein